MYRDGLPILFSESQTKNWVGIIGSRKASVSENKTAYTLAQRCVARGKKIVSGLAKGIDTSAFAGTLTAGGIPIAIVSTSKDEPIYPKENQALAEKIRKHGCILHPFDTPSQKEPASKFNQFQKRLIERDLLLAHLCPVLVVVKDEDEPIDGGSKWAIAYALKWGKKVFRLDNRFIFHENPPVLSCKLNWQMELMWEGLHL